MARNYGLRKLRNLLEQVADAQHYLFSPRDIASQFPELGRQALSMLLSRAVDDALLVNVCRGLYMYDKVRRPSGLLLYHAASKLRADTFNYISLESALSDEGVISQIPLQWLTVMSGGRSSTISCGGYGTIEFIHSARTSAALVGRVHFDERCGLWRADVRLALEDMKRCRRPLDLIDWSAADEFV